MEGGLTLDIETLYTFRRHLVALLKVIDRQIADYQVGRLTNRENSELNRR